MYATLKLWYIQFLFDWSGQKLHGPNGPKTSLNQLFAKQTTMRYCPKYIYLDAFTFFAVQYSGENFWFTTSSKLRMPFSRGLLVNFFRWVCASKVIVTKSRVELFFMKRNLWFGLVLVLEEALKSSAILVNIFYLWVFFHIFSNKKDTKLDFLYIKVDWHKSEKTAFLL